MHGSFNQVLSGFIKFIMCSSMFVSFLSKLCRWIPDRFIQSWPIIPGSSASSLADVVASPREQSGGKPLLEVQRMAESCEWKIWIPRMISSEATLLTRVIQRQSTPFLWILDKLLAITIDPKPFKKSQPRHCHCQNWMYSKNPSLPFESEGFISRTEGTLLRNRRTDSPHTLPHNPSRRSHFLTMPDLGH